MGVGKPSCLSPVLHPLQSLLDLVSNCRNLAVASLIEMQIGLFVEDPSTVVSSGRLGGSASNRSSPLLIATRGPLLCYPSPVGVLPPGRHLSVCTSPRSSVLAGTVAGNEFPQLVDVCHHCDIVQLHLHSSPPAVLGKALQS